MTPPNIRDALVGIEGFNLLIIDTPPSIEDHPEEFKLLAKAADLILVPTGQSDDDLDSVRPWMRYVKKHGRNAAFVMNRVKPRTKSFTEAQRKLLADGRICPVEVPDYDDIQFTSSKGLGLAELKGGKGTEHMAGVWAFVKSEIGL
jgi:chromosome partitioning protein